MDLIKTIYNIERERFSRHSLLSGSIRVFRLLNGLSEGMKKRNGSFGYQEYETEMMEMLFDSSNEIIQEDKKESLYKKTLFAIDTTTGIIREVLYKSNKINSDSPAWRLLENKEDIYALNNSNVPNKPKWVPFRLSLLISFAKQKNIPLVVGNNQISLPYLNVRITSDLQEAIENPNIIQLIQVHKDEKVYSDKHQK